MSHLFFRLYNTLNSLLQLSFDDSLKEKRFLKEYLKDNIRQNKLASLIGLLGYLIFIPISYVTLPSEFLMNAIIIFAIPIPALIIFYFTVGKERSYSSQLLHLFIFGFIVCSAPLIFFNLTHENYQIHLNNFVLPIIGILVMYGVPFAISILITSIAVLLLLLLGLVSDAGSHITFYNVFVLVVILTIGIVSGYMIEISKRQKYLSKYALEDINENLEEMIKEEVRKSKEKDKQLYEASKMVAMGEMIGNIAHQWRQPLNIISTAATGMHLHKQYGILKDDDFENQCTIINENVQYLSKVIDDFSNFFVEKDVLVKEFNLEESIEQFLDLAQNETGKGIEIVKNIEKNITLENYPSEMVQCFINIFNNSVEALEKNGSTKKLFFIDVFRKNKETVVIVLKDNAGGISNEILSKVFDPYFTTKHQSMGTGLGLYIVYNFISKSMNGHISVQNSQFNYNGIDYKGAEFIIEVPYKNN